MQNLIFKNALCKFFYAPTFYTDLHWLCIFETAVFYDSFDMIRPTTIKKR